MQISADVQSAANSLLEQLPPKFSQLAPQVCGLILGTGLGNIGESIALSPTGRVIPWHKIQNFPKCHVPSHKGAFIFGMLGSTPVLAQQGRIHLYEGYSPFEICMAVRVMILCGIRTVIITNAAGALNPLFEAGSLMCLSDMINHTGQSPLTGGQGCTWGDMFPDMSQTFSPSLQKLALETAIECGIRLERGVYIGVHGPEMETPAETRMYRNWGADAIGMSSVLEIIAARQMGAHVLGLSCLTNKNLPDCMQAAPIEEVIEVAKQTSQSMESLISCFLKKWSQSN